MKKLLICLGIFATTLLTAQDNAAKSLVVDYEMELKLDADKVINSIPSAFRAQVADAIKAEVKNGIFMDYQLKTNGNESVYSLKPKVDNSQNESGMILSQLSSQDKEPTYKMLKEQTFYKQYNVGPTPYVVNDSLKNYQWTITREQDQIAGFDVRKANGVYNDSITIEAWFAPKLQFKDGPDQAWGLPGLILKATYDIAGSEAIVTAKNVAVKDEELSLSPPKSDKTYTMEEFEQEMVAFQEKMREMYGGGVEEE